MKSIVIDVDKLGGVTIKAIGFRGKACESATQPIERALGMVNGRVKTPEYYATATVAAGQSVGGGR